MKTLPLVHSNLTPNFLSNLQIQLHPVVIIHDTHITEWLPSNPRRKDGMGIADINVDGKMVPSIQLGTPHMATIMILDDDHGGIFQACTLLWAFTFPK